MRILIAEDEPISRRMLTKLLANLNHDVLSATNGREAWEAYQLEEVDMVITDWIMPEMDGPDLCRLIRGKHRRKYPYIILLTSMSGKGYYLEGIEAGADDFLTKPYDPDLLRARLSVANRMMALRDEVSRLRGLLPICCYCKKIRDDQNLWTQIEAYIGAHSDADFTHGICPECEDRYVRPQLEALTNK